MEEAEREEEEGEEDGEESLKELEPEEEEIAMAIGCWKVGVSFVLLGFGRKMEFTMKRADSG